MSYRYLFDIALILFSTKLLGMLTRKFKMPQVVGALLAGVILGPACLNILHETEFLHQIAQLGVIVLMFTVGLETDVKELKKAGKSSVIIALFGVAIPLIGGFGIASMFNDGASSIAVLENIFIGIILTATSVSITVETLKEMGKLNSDAGNAILGAAIIDDILGIVALTIITSVADTSVNPVFVIAKIFGFFAFSGVVMIVFHSYYDRWVEHYNKEKKRFVVFAFVLCLMMAFIGEEFFGVADITGAFIAGLILTTNERREYVAYRFETISYMLLSPIFFASIGIKVEIPAMSAMLLIFTLLLILVAVGSKMIGCYFGARVCKYNTRESLQIGTGMVSRGEVALIVAQKGLAIGIMNSMFFGPIVIMVIFTAIVTPVILKLVFSSDREIDLVGKVLHHN